MNKIFAASLTHIQINTLSIVALVAAAKLGSFLKDILVAKYFGISSSVDLYLYTLIIPLCVFNIFAGGFNVYFVPQYLKLKKEDGEGKARGFFSEIWRVSWLASLALSILYVPFAVYILPYLSGSINVAEEALMSLLWISSGTSVFFFFSILANILSSLLQAEHFYAESLFPQILIPATSVVMISLGNQQLHIYSVVWGMAFGSLICFGVLYYNAAVKHRLFEEKRDFSLASTQVLNELFILLLAVIIPNIVDVVDRQMASSLGPGALSVFHYGSLIPDGIQGIIGQSLSIGFLSYFSQWYFSGEKRRIVEAIQKIFVYLILIVLPICIFLVIYADSILIFVFQRGAFMAQDTQAVKEILQPFCFSLVLAPPIIMGVRILTVIGKTKIFLLIAVAMLSLKVLLNFLYALKFSLAGLPLATITMFFIINIILFSYLQRVGFAIFTRVLCRVVISAFAFLLMTTTAFLLMASLTVDLERGVKFFLGVALFAPFLCAAIFLSQKLNHKFTTD